MSQPKWKFVTNLGDVDPLESGGLFLYIDEHGVYPAEMERLEPREDERFEVRRVVLDRHKEVRVENTLYLVPVAYQADWPHPVSAYEEWFVKSLAAVASTMGREECEIRKDLTNDNPIVRARAYQDIADHHGWDNFDQEPRILRPEDVEKRYKEGEIA